MIIGEKITKHIVKKLSGISDSDVTFEVLESGGFQYGNQTVTIVTIGEDKTPFDTRYFTGNLQNFIEFWEENYLDKERFYLS